MLDDEKKWFRVSLRLFGNSLNPAEIDGLLGMEADATGFKGAARTGKNNKTYAPYRTNIWIYRSRLGHEIGFDEQILSIFEDLGDKVGALKTLLDGSGIGGELFCGFGYGNGQGGDTIALATLLRITEAGLSFCLDLYPPRISDAEESQQDQQRDGIDSTAAQPSP